MLGCRLYFEKHFSKLLANKELSPTAGELEYEGSMDAVEIYSGMLMVHLTCNTETQNI